MTEVVTGGINTLVTHWGEALAAIGGLGTASFAIVDASRAIIGGGPSAFGYKHLDAVYQCLEPALARALGGEWREVLKGYWINGTAKDQQIATVVSLVRLGLSEDNAEDIMTRLQAAQPSLLHTLAPRPATARDGQSASPVSLAALKSGAKLLTTGVDAPAAPPHDATMDEGKPRRGVRKTLPPSTDDRAQAMETRIALDALGRFDAIVRTRLDAAFDLADHAYRSQARLYAGVVALLLSAAVGYAYYVGDHSPKAEYPWFYVVLIGILAVPLAPMAKDLATALKSAADALKKTMGPAT